MRTTLTNKALSDDAEIRRAAAIFGWDVGRFEHEMTHRLLKMPIDRDTEGYGPLYVLAINLDETKFETADEAKAAAKRFEAYAAEAFAKGETEHVYRTEASGFSVRVEYGYGDGEWQQPG